MTTDWSTKRVTIMGLGLFGGGVAAAQYFANHGATVLVTDKRTREQLAESIAQVEGVNVSFRLGGHDVHDFVATDLVVANPAVPVDNEFLEAARKTDVRVTSEMNVFFEHCPAPVIGITGSNGKSTTAALVHHILASSGRKARLGGNIGHSLLTEVEDIAPDERVVLEISSFQLEYLDVDALSPHVAVVLNLRPNHLDRHGTMEAYAAAKQHIVEHQSAEDIAVLSADDARVHAMADATRARIALFSTQRRKRGQEPFACRPAGCCAQKAPDPFFAAWLDGDVVRCVADGEESVVGGLDQLKLIGRHNLENVTAAVAVAMVEGVEPRAIEEALATFQPLPHRLQTVAEIDGVRWVNDSIATNPDSTSAALACFGTNVILIAGGSSKDIPYDAMVVPVRHHVRLLLLIGETARAIEETLRASNPEKPEIVQCGTLEAAVAAARERATSGDVVLLSPACASFDQFRNFRERGERFTALAQNPA